MSDNNECANCNKTFTLKHGVLLITKDAITLHVCGECVALYKQAGWVVIWDRFEE